jgi:hypothetical protein
MNQKKFYTDDNKYELHICQDENTHIINMHLYKNNDCSKILFDLILKPSWFIKSRYCVPKDQEDYQNMFVKGEYYQDTWTKHDKSITESLGKIIYNLILENKTELPFIKTIYSTTLKLSYQKFESDIFTHASIHFWMLQLKNFPANYSYDSEKGKFKFVVNE